MSFILRVCQCANLHRQPERETLTGEKKERENVALCLIKRESQRMLDGEEANSKDIIIINWII